MIIKGNFSKDPTQDLAANLSRGYVGVRIEQGVPLLDRDINLLADLVRSSFNSIVETYIGNGCPPGNDGAFYVYQFGANPPPNDFAVNAGSFVVGGVTVTTNIFNYRQQADVDPLHTPAVGTTRVDEVYLDVWLSEVAFDNTAGIDLNNTVDASNPYNVNMRTSVRLKPEWRVRVAEGPAKTPAPNPQSGHAYCKIAEITRNGPLIKSAQIVDKRVMRLNLADLVKRVNVLQQDITIIMGALSPKIDPTAPLDVTDGYAGRLVVLRGKNLNVGAVKVTLHPKADPNDTTDVPIVNEPRANSIMLKIPDDAPLGNVDFTVTTDFGSVSSDTDFQVWGMLHFGTNGLAPFWSANIKKNQWFTIYGVQFDCPGTLVEIFVNSTWTALVTAPGNATSIQAQAPNFVGSFSIRARNDAMDTYMHVIPPGNASITFIP